VSADFLFGDTAETPLSCSALAGTPADLATVTKSGSTACYVGSAALRFELGAIQHQRQARDRLDHEGGESNLQIEERWKTGRIPPVWPKPALASQVLSDKWICSALRK